MRRDSILAWAACALLVPAVGAAQDRVMVNIDAAQQTTTTTFTSTSAFTEFVEEGHITAQSTVAKGPVYGGGLIVRVWKNVVLGVDVSYYSKAGSAQIDAQLPHPFLFDRPRLVSATAAGIARKETGTHLIVGVIIPATDRMDLVISGGPSFFQVQQDLVSGVTYTHTYPYDAVQFTGVTMERLTDRATGYHAGADVIVKFSQHVGVGGTLRFTRGTISSTLDGDRLSFDVGGLLAGGGLRLMF
jgi:hypothetical protein